MITHLYRFTYVVRNQTTCTKPKTVSTLPTFQMSDRPHLQPKTFIFHLCGQVDLLLIRRRTFDRGSAHSIHCFFYPEYDQSSMIDMQTKVEICSDPQLILHVQTALRASFYLVQSSLVISDCSVYPISGMRNATSSGYECLTATPYSACSVQLYRRAISFHGNAKAKESSRNTQMRSTEN